MYFQLAFIPCTIHYIQKDWTLISFPDLTKSPHNESKNKEIQYNLSSTIFPREMTVNSRSTFNVLFVQLIWTFWKCFVLFIQRPLRRLTYSTLKFMRSTCGKSTVNRVLKISVNNTSKYLQLPQGRYYKLHYISQNLILCLHFRKLNTVGRCCWRHLTFSFLSNTNGA